MTVAELLQIARARVGKGFPDFLGVEILLANVLGKDRSWLMAHDDAPIFKEEEGQFWDLFSRFHAGEPVAYLTGKKEFYGLEFLVDKNVLIPRPETELLVEKVLQFAGENFKDERRLRILDVGTGSGCIAISLAKHLPHSFLTAVDISVGALKIAIQNAKRHEVLGNVVFVESDLLANVKGIFDVMVANLPYIGTERYAFVSREAQEYEPHVALFGGTDGLRLYERLFRQVASLQRKPRLLLGEFGFLQGDEMRELLNKFFTHEEWRVEKDYAGIERIFVVGFGGNF